MSGKLIPVVKCVQSCSSGHNQADAILTVCFSGHYVFSLYHSRGFKETKWEREWGMWWKSQEVTAPTKAAIVPTAWRVAPLLTHSCWLQHSSVQSLSLSLFLFLSLFWFGIHLTKQFKASCGSLGEWGQRLKVYQSSGSLRWARAVRTAASPVWPAQERGMEKVERRGMRHAMVLRWTDWKEGGKKEKKERKRKRKKWWKEGRKKEFVNNDAWK